MPGTTLTSKLEQTCEEARYYNPILRARCRTDSKGYIAYNGVRSVTDGLLKKSKHVEDSAGVAGCGRESQEFDRRASRAGSVSVNSYLGLTLLGWGYSLRIDPVPI